MLQWIKIGPTLFYYILKQCITSCFIIFVPFTLLIAFIDITSLASRLPHLSMQQLLSMELLNLPNLTIVAMPYVLMFALMYAFFRMSKEHHITIQYSIGISPLQLLIAPAMFSIVLGILYTTLFTSIATITQEQYKKRWSAYNTLDSTTEITITRDNIWLREKINRGHRIIHSTISTTLPITLMNVRILEMDDTQKLQRTYTVHKMTLKNGYFHVDDATLITLDNTRQKLDNLRIKTTINDNLIKFIVASPNDISFWNLPVHIQNLQRGGINAKEYIFTYHKLLSMPLLFLALVFFASYFTVRPYVRTAPIRIIGVGIITAFMLFFFLNISQAMIFLTTLPAYMLGWLPSLTILCLGIFLILSMEKRK